MDGQDLHQTDASRPALGFPLGTALVLLLIFFLSGVFSCCYHWDKLRSLRRSLRPGRNPDAEDMESPSKSNPSPAESKQKQKQSLPVIMPGDEIPKFIAWPCPGQPSSPHKLEVETQLPKTAL